MPMVCDLGLLRGWRVLPVVANSRMMCRTHLDQRWPHFRAPAIRRQWCHLTSWPRINPRQTVQCVARIWATSCI